MPTPYRGYTEVPGAVTPDVPYRVNLALREVDADLQDTESKINTRLKVLESSGAGSGNPLEINDAVVAELLREDGSATSKQAAARAVAAVPAYLDRLNASRNPRHIGPLQRVAAALLKQDTAVFKWANLGSSTANGGNTSKPEYAWTYRVASVLTDRAVLRLETATAPPATGVQVYSGAVGGTTSENYLNDALRQKLRFVKPQLMTHMVGSNDYGHGRTPQAYAANMRTWLTRMLSDVPGSVHVLIHQQGRQDVAQPVAPWQAFGEALAGVAAEFPDNAVFLDLDSRFNTLGYTSTVDRAGLGAGDRLHMNDAGHRIMTDAVLEFLGIDPGYMDETFTPGTLNGGTYPNLAVGNYAKILLPKRPYPRKARLHLQAFAGGTNADLEIHQVINGVQDIRSAVRVAGGNQQGWTGVAVAEIPANVPAELHVNYRVLSGSLYLSGNAAYSAILATTNPL